MGRLVHFLSPGGVRIVNSCPIHMSLRHNSLLDRLEPRRLFAASAIDPSFHFDQAAIDRAARTHLTLTSIIDAGAGRTLMLGHTPAVNNKQRLILIELDSTGGLNRAFSHDGLSDTGLDVGGGGTIRVSADGYIYLAAADTMTRFRGDGARDRGFAGGHSIGFTDGTATRQVLDVQPGSNGGVDVLRAVDRDLGRTFLNPYHIEEETYDSVLQLTHISAGGTVTKVWEKSARDGTFADKVYVDFDKGSVTPLAGGGWVVLSARQQNIDNIDSAFGNDIQGDTFVDFVSAGGTTTNEKVFNTGSETALADVRVQGNGSRVRFTYGGRREVELTNGVRIRRYNLAVGPTTPGLNDQVLTINGQRLPYRLPYPFEPATGFTVSLLNIDGSVDKRFGDGGTFKLTGTVGKFPEPFVVLSAQPGSVLLSWQNDDARSTVSIIRLWLGPQPAATLTSTAVRGRTATVTVQYRARSGIAAATVNSHDAVLTSKRGQARLRLLSKVIRGDTVTATYRATDLLPGSYFIDLLAGEVGSGENAVNAAQRLGIISIV